MATETQITSLRQILNKYITSDLDTIIIREHLGANSLSPLKEKLLELKEKAEKLEQIAENIGGTVLTLITQTYTQLGQQLDRAKTYNDSQFPLQKATIQQQVLNIYEQHLNWWGQIAGLLNATISDIEKERLIIETRKLADDLRNQKDISDSYAKDIENLKANLEQELNIFEDRYKDLLTKAELTKQQIIFNEEAAKNKISTRWWFAAIFIVVAILGGTLYYIFKNFCFEFSCIDVSTIEKYDIANCVDCGKTLLLFELAKASIYRLFIISVIIYMLTFCIKNYNAQRHNYIVNTHKSNSLSAAVALLSRAKTNEGNDNIMLQAAQAIFSHQNSGFIGKETEPSSPTIIEKLVNKS